MPSVKVRGHPYNNLHEVFDLPQEQSTNRIHTQRSLPGLWSTANDDQAQLSTPTPVPTGRPRAFTTTSRIYAHTLRNSQIRNSTYGRTEPPLDLSTSIPKAASPTDNHPTTEEQLQPVIVHGSHADLRLSAHSYPGLVERSLNEPTDERPLDSTRDHLHHHDDIVEHLDVIDSQVAVVSSLTNAVNAIVIPPSAWYSRKPVLVLPKTPHRNRGEESTSVYEDSLDQHVNDVLERPSKVRRTLMGIWSFLKTPMGIITGIYGFLVVFWGAAIVIFLAKIINLHDDNLQGFWVEVSSQVETGLFTVTSIGLIPSRILDTFRETTHVLLYNIYVYSPLLLSGIWKIWRYKKKTIELRKKAGLPQLFDVDDLPDPYYDPNYVHVLTESEQEDLHRQQRKFQYSQTWYRAHGTETHRAFPINMALWICLMNDGNSIFQIFLCGTMWGMDRFRRPAWSTGILIPASFLCGIAAAILIWRGGERTKRVEEVKERLRAALLEKYPNIPDIYVDVTEPRSIQNEKAVVQSRPLQSDNTSVLASPTEIDEHMLVPPAEHCHDRPFSS
ncbi:hypothetical protein CVT24_003638 [Panaeolus cyanescens]|uniref:Uncharacterized protein n=1 Tax=Panaeolus cyanescens TaxID=181874 RepID=A0A409Y7Y0_9AGAR|nr:hypothetical protein CVT24_003638 [Panaeolus cyanescens]